LNIPAGTETIVYIITATQLLCPTGKYVPALAYMIHIKNPTAELKVNLHGKNIHHTFCKDKIQIK
jgi:hypothetical protein